MKAKHLLNADILERKKIFSIHLKKYVPLARYIYDQLIRHPTASRIRRKFSFVT